MAQFISRRDLNFLLYEWLDVSSLTKHERFAEQSREIFDAILETAGRIAREKFAPHAAKLDANEPHFDGERVHLIPEVKQAVDAFAKAGFLSMSFGAEHGGMGLPYTLSQAAMAVFYAANVSTAAYPLLTMAAANLLVAHGSKDQIETYLDPMLEGRYFGTMCLSEPGAGSSLADILTTARQADDGTWRLRGNKMWISGAEHDLSENILHFVLARIEGAPAGTRGISLFLVPKFLVEDGGSLGERNDVHIAGLNHKMGYRGTVNCVLNLGESDACVGYLVGEPNQGLRAMFHMMNEARIGVGLGASMLGYAGYLFSLEYARERKQGRVSRDPATPPVPIVEHADVRRMLLAQKAYAEGGLALGLYCAMLVDEVEASEEAGEAKLLLEILTPIAKAWPSEWCLKANELAIQVLGGYGYSREYPVERYYRDNRLNPIHEGTNGIQALDLLGRKVTMKEGAALRALLGRMTATLEKARAHEVLEDLCAQFEAGLERATTTTLTLLGAAQAGKTDIFLANASVYLEMLGHTVVAWMWMEQATVAAASEASDFYRGKLQAARFFLRWELPKTVYHAELLTSLDPTCLEMQDEWF